MAFSVDKQTFYRQGFQLAWDVRSDPDSAWRWLERMKGRALLDALSGDAEEPGDAAGAPLVVADPARGDPGSARRPAGAAGSSPVDAANRSGHRAGPRDLARRSEPPDFGQVRDLLRAEEEACQRRVVVAEYLCTPERTLLLGGRADWDQPRGAAVNV